MKGIIDVGCGSWSDPEYVGVLYPDGLPAEKRLSCYATWFNRVEVNSSYYATPRRETIARWVKETPAGFTFDIKLHRAFSQSPAKVAAENRLLPKLLEAVEPLIKARKLGAFLLVLAPGFGPARHTLEELDALAEKLRSYTLAVELRHIGWVQGANRARTLAYFRERGLAWVAVDMPRLKDDHLLPVIDEVTQPRLAYLRLHGRNKNYLEAESAADRHTYEYGARELKELIGRIRVLAAKAERVQVVANNHARDFAPKTALALKSLLGQKAESRASVTKRPARRPAASLT